MEFVFKNVRMVILSSKIRALNAIRLAKHALKQQIHVHPAFLDYFYR